MARPPIAQLMVVAKTTTITAMAMAVVAASYSVRQVVVVEVAIEIAAAVVIAALAEVNCRNQKPSHRPILLKIQVVIRFEVGVGMVLLARAVNQRHC